MAERPTLVCLMGMPGAGKTVYAEKIRESRIPNALIISSDDVRWTMSMGREYKSAAERFVVDVMTSYTRGCLIYGRSVIYDATNLTRDKRSILAWYAHEYGSQAELHHIKCSTAESTRRSSKWIPRAGIHRLADSFEEPDGDEGWDRIETIDAENGWRVASVHTFTPAKGTIT